jgi:hypothetical protein
MNFRDISLVLASLYLTIFAVANTAKVGLNWKQYYLYYVPQDESCEKVTIMVAPKYGFFGAPNMKLVRVCEDNKVPSPLDILGL